MADAPASGGRMQSGLTMDSFPAASPRLRGRAARLRPHGRAACAGRGVATNQFSVTEYDAAAPEGGMQLPAVWFLYDLSPISVDIRERRPGFLHFLTRVCAVIGGGFAVTGPTP